MAKTQTAPKTQTVPPAQPAPQLPATTNGPKPKVETNARKESWEVFSDELRKRADEISSQLPSTITRDRFINATIAAVKQNPEILTATPRSLFSAITKSAQDGLLADGREGIITVYEQKIRNSNPVKYEIVAQWNPMFYGIRKRAKEIDGLIIDAQVVYVGDEFDYELGDNPFIKHKPVARNAKVDASAGVAAYAIFKHPTEGILHREVMWKFDIFDVMNQSKNKNGLMWTLFWTEGWRKTVGRRGAKTVPMSPQLERIITRDDADFSFNNGPSLPPPRPTPPPPPDDDDDEDDPAPPSPKQAQITAPTVTTHITDDMPDDDEAFSATEFLSKIEEALGFCEDENAIEETWDAELDVESTLAHDHEDLGLAFKIKDRHLARVREKARAALEDAGQAGFSFGGDDDTFPGDR